MAGQAPAFRYSHNETTCLISHAGVILNRLREKNGKLKSCALISITKRLIEDLAILAHEKLHYCL